MLDMFSGSSGGGMAASAGMGAAAGALAGTMILPGIGTAVGAGLGAGMSLLGGYLASEAAEENNDALKLASKLAIQQAGARTKMIYRSADFDREGLMLDAEAARFMHGRAATKLRGDLRVATAESGTTLAGSRSRILDQADFEAVWTRKALEVRLARALRRIDLNTEASLLQQGQALTNTLTGYDAQQQSTGMAAFTGGLGGLQTGLSIGGGVMGMGAAWQSMHPQPPGVAPVPVPTGP